MSKENQILLIKKFINSDKETLLINQVNENLGIFYLSITKFFADQINIKLEIDSNVDYKELEDDLFGNKTIQIFNITNTKKLNLILKFNKKKIIFTDYKNYKNLNSKFDSINGYQFEKDISYFVKEELNINNDELLYFCKSNPVLLFSETSKYLINKNKYSNDQSLIEEKNSILEIRKVIFGIKKNSFDIKNLYKSIKEEAKFKKLNFLTY